MGALIGPTLSSYAEDNFAQYDIAQVYASPRCLLEIEKTLYPELLDRLAVESIEIFFVELLLLQTASIRRICYKVTDYMNSDDVYAGHKNYNILFDLSREMSETVRFFDYDHFRYPTVSIACQKISQRFGMETEIQKYYEYRSILEQMIEISHEQRDKIESANINFLLLILTMVQILPTLVDTYQMLQSGAWSASILISWALSIGTCFILYQLFRLYRLRHITRANKTHKRRP